MTRFMRCVLFFYIVTLSLCGCSGDSHSDGSSTGSITARLVWSAAHDASQTIAYAPAEVAKVRVTISATGRVPVSKDFPPSAANAAIDGIPAGTGWRLDALGIDTAGTTIYEGQVGNITVRADAITDAGAVALLPQPPSTPTGLTASAAAGAVTLQWVPVTGATSYNIYWGTSPGVTKSSGTRIAAVLNPFTHDGLAGGATYYYVVTAVNGGGESAVSTETSAATPLADVSGFIYAPDGSPVMNVALTLASEGSGTFSQSTATAGNGKFDFPGVPDGTYRIAAAPPVLYSLDPSSETVTVHGRPVTGLSFQARWVGLSISGTVTSAGTGLPGVTVATAGGDSATTDANGGYTITGLSSGTYLVAPVLSGYTFTPASQSVAVDFYSAAGINFTATRTGALRAATATASGPLPRPPGSWRDIF